MPKSKSKKVGGGDAAKDPTDKSAGKDEDELKTSSTEDTAGESTTDAAAADANAETKDDAGAGKGAGDEDGFEAEAPAAEKSSNAGGEGAKAERKEGGKASDVKHATRDGDDEGNDSERDEARKRRQGDSDNGPKATSTTQETANQNTKASSANAKETDPLDDVDSDSKDSLLTMSFNQDGGCLAVGTGTGFRICNVRPFQETFRRSLGGDRSGGAEGGAGIAHVEMLYRTNLLALTGHSASPQYPPNKVLIYDDHLQRTIGELSFRQKVLTTKLRRDRIVVVLRDRVYVYNFSDLALLDKVHTGDNPLGLIGISMDNGGVGGSTTSVERAEDVLGSTGGSSAAQQRNNGMVLACPSTTRGQVRVELYGLRRTTAIDAHESALGALALSVDGSLLATASERGTVIRLFDTRGVTIGGGGSKTAGAGAGSESTPVSSSVPLREFRRGVERATISCLTFSHDSGWLGCASNHGTVHVFQTHDEAAAKKKRSSSVTGKAMRMLPKLVSAPRKYLMDGVQSCAQVRGVPHPRACAFVPDRERTIAVAGLDEYGNGCLLLSEFGKGGGGVAGGGKTEADSSEARRLGYHRFFKSKSPSGQSGGRRRTKSKEKADDATEEGGAYVDDAPVDVRMNHISMGDENEDDFVPIDYNNEEK